MNTLAETSSSWISFIIPVERFLYILMCYPKRGTWIFHCSVRASCVGSAVHTSKSEGKPRAVVIKIKSNLLWTLWSNKIIRLLFAAVVSKRRRKYQTGIGQWTILCTWGKIIFTHDDHAHTPARRLYAAHSYGRVQVAPNVRPGLQSNSMRRLFRQSFVSRQTPPIASYSPQERT